MGHRPTVLLIDSNIAVCEIARALLTRNGYDVEILHSDESVYDLLAQQQVDVIVSDVRRPGVDGLTVVRKVRGDPATADIPIILLTMLDSMEDEFEGYLAGADAYMSKPFRARDLVATVDQVLNRRDQTGSGVRPALVQEVARVLAVITPDRARMVSAAMKQAGFELQTEDELPQALARIDRERFHLLICDTVHDPDAVAQVREFLSHFALALPVVILHPRAAAPVLPSNDAQYHALRVPATPTDLADIARRAIVDFGGL